MRINNVRNLLDIFLEKGALYNFDYGMNDIFAMIEYNKRLPEINVRKYPDLLEDYNIGTKISNDEVVWCKGNKRFPLGSEGGIEKACQHLITSATFPSALVDYRRHAFYHNLLFRLIESNKHSLFRVKLFEDIKLIVLVKDLHGKILYLNKYTEDSETRAKVLEFSEDRRTKFSVIDYLRIRLVDDIATPDIEIKTDSGKIIPSIAWAKMFVVYDRFDDSFMSEYERMMLKIILGAPIDFVEPKDPVPTFEVKFSDVPKTE